MSSSSGVSDDARPIPQGQIGHAVELKLAMSSLCNTSCGRPVAAAACAHRAICALLHLWNTGSIMQIGVHLPHIGRKATPEAVTRAAVQAEELGLADVWVSEHVIVPKDAPYPPSPAFLEPILTL